MIHFARRIKSLGPLPLAVLLACGTNPNVGGLPVADAGFDLTVRTGSAIILDGESSTDPDGFTLEYTWSLVTRPTGSTATLVGLTTARPSFTADVEGFYLVRLIVNNPSRSSEPDFVTVRASNGTPLAVAECVSMTCQVIHGTNAGVRGSASSDPDSDPLTFAWSQITDAGECMTLCPEIATCNPTTTAAVFVSDTVANATFAAPDVANEQLVLALEVSDGVSTDTACVEILVTNAAPVINSVSTTNLASVPIAMVDEGTDFRLTALTVDNDGDMRMFLWEQISGSPAAVIANADMETTTVTAPATTMDTTLEFRLTVSDGFESTQDTVSILINDI